MASPAMGPSPEGQRFRPENKEATHIYKMQLPDGTFMVATSKAEMIKKMQEYRENIN